MNGILFAGCSFTWGQGLYYYSDLKRIPTMEEWSFDYSLMTDALIDYKNTVRYPRLVANHFKTFEVCRDTNGGSDEDSLQFIKMAFDIKDRKEGSFDYLTYKRFKYEDISYVIFQTTQPYRSSFKFVYKDVYLLNFGFKLDCCRNMVISFFMRITSYFWPTFGLQVFRLIVVLLQGL
jgi:hypothetical protein